MEELAQEYFEDAYANDPKIEREARLRLEGSDAILTGDPLVDKWERAINRGETPDLTEGLPEHILKRKPKITSDFPMLGSGVTETAPISSSAAKLFGGKSLHDVTDEDLFPTMTSDSFEPGILER